MITLTSISSTDYKKAAPLKIIYGFHHSPFGSCLVGVVEKGLCFLGFTEKNDGALKEVHKNWPGAELIEDVASTVFLVQKIFSEKEQSLSLFVKGTDFQVAVWKALLALKEGSVTSYSAVAKTIGKPAAIRAAASAVGDNPISYVIPCHRVVSKRSLPLGGRSRAKAKGRVPAEALCEGWEGGYRWGAELKKKLLEHEKRATL